jgi:4-alpha-glucanotransferase
MSDIGERARRHNIQTAWHGIEGTAYHPPERTLEALLAAFGASADAPGARAAPRLQAPEGIACYLPAWLEEGRVWGVAAQLYQIRSVRNWGIGDFADLAALAELLGQSGADFIGLNPLHALFLADPGHCSPFSPSNRRFLNPLYIAVDFVPGFHPGDVPRPLLDQVRSGDLVDYKGVAEAKLTALTAIWARRGGDNPHLTAFRAKGGVALERHCLFEALSTFMASKGIGRGWQAWPDAYHDPESAAVRQFAAEHEHDVAFHAWLQFVADTQLAVARDAAMAAGMRIGLYLDFAVGEEPDGSSTWADRTLVLPGVQVGAPPDYFTAAGQNWALAPLSPVAVAATGAEPYRLLMEDATRRAGALRIDHVMGLWQLFLIPEGSPPAEGTYVRYPFQDMLRALASASQANGTIVIGEDLGNVPEGFREAMAAVRILSYRILLFERTGDGFRDPSEYPRQALACLSTHDLPTLAGWWHGDDIALRNEHGLFGPEAAEEQQRARDHERSALLEQLHLRGLLPRAETHPVDEIPIALHRHLARAPSYLFSARLEDLAGERDPVNLPSTVDEYPNWRRKLRVSIEDLAVSPLFTGITSALRDERPR